MRRQFIWIIILDRVTFYFSGINILFISFYHDNVSSKIVTFQHKLTARFYEYHK